VLVGACVGGGVGMGVWGGGSCHEMVWGGMRGGPCPSIYSHEENICRDFKSHSEGISQEENTWRYIDGIFGQYF
jgi:hypothetical protein